jgi:hypothetical protein
MKVSDQLHASASLPPEKKPPLLMERQASRAAFSVGEDLKYGGSSLQQAAEISLCCYGIILERL